MDYELTKEYYKIKEVSELFNIAPSTLRFWEKEFPEIQPIRSKSNIRYYRKQDIETLRIIYYLIKTKGLKIDAAKNQLRNNRQNISCKTEVIDRLKSIRADIIGILKALDKRKI